MKSIPVISSGTIKCIASPELVGGHSPLSSPDGQKIENCGPPASHVNLGRGRVEGVAPPTQGTYGPTSSLSSVPDGPLSQWERTLRENLAEVGSTECVLIWQASRTPQGLSISRLVASTRRTSATGSGGSPWPTTQTRQKGGGDYADPAKAAARLNSGHQVNLQDLIVASAPWSTVRASDGEKGGPNQSFGAGGQPLAAQAAQAATWATVTAHDIRYAGYPESFENRNAERSQPLNEQAAHLPLDTGTSTSGSPARTASRGALNPEFTFWLMGLPQEFLAFAPAGTRLYRPSQRKS